MLRAALLGLVVVASLSGCFMFGFSVLTKVAVVHDYVGTWTAQGYYFARVTFTVENTGLVEIATARVRFRVTTTGGNVFEDDTAVGPIAVGDKTAGEIDIETTGDTVVKVELVGSTLLLN